MEQREGCLHGGDPSERCWWWRKSPGGGMVNNRHRLKRRPAFYWANVVCVLIELICSCFQCRLICLNVYSRRALDSVYGC